MKIPQDWTEKAKEDGHQSDETDGTFIEKVKSVFYQDLHPKQVSYAGRTVLS